MDTTTLSSQARPAILHPAATRGWFRGRQGRRLREALLAYAFLLPAIIIVGLFGLFPLLFAAFESTLRGLNKIVGTYDGLGNFVIAIGDLTYVLFFWLAAILVFIGGREVVLAAQLARERKERLWVWLPVGLACGGGFPSVWFFIFRLLPALLSIPSQMRGRDNTPENFQRLLGEAFALPAVQQALWIAVGLLVVGAVLFTFVARSERRVRHAQYHNYAGAFINATVTWALAVVLVRLTWTQINQAYAEALANGGDLALWSHIVTISAGFLLLLAAWWLWGSASKQASTGGMAFRLGAGAALIVGGWMLIGELPAAIATGDRRWWLGVINTFYYSLGTIPTQLGIALLLAVLLFQDLKGKAAFRIIYFIPYIAPFVGTAAVFRIIFSARPTGPMNTIITALGGNSLPWLNDPTGLFQRIVGSAVALPEWAAGPSLALIVIMIYGTWTFVGFNTVIFMAGLGNIPRELYEAAQIDGGGRWDLFRSITLPLLSPTIYFLTLYSVIGTFKAFNHIYVLRTAAALGTADTASVVIFQAIRENVRYGYASALAILLLIIILILTVVNNRLASERVFYG